MKYILSILLFVVVLTSCVKNNPDPAWLEVNEWTLETNPNSEYPTGELTHNLTEAWVYVNDEIVGIFEVPFKIPILKSGNVNIKIYPAIKNNGISATKKIYPFLQVFEVNADLVQNQTLTLNPKTRYYNSVQFWLEDFEDATPKLENDPNSATTIVKDNDPAFLQWGNSYGVVNLNAADSTWIAYTADNLYLPKGEEVYLEIDYHTTNALVTGMIAVSASSVTPNQYIQLNPQSPAEVQWKKIYIDLREIISNSTSAIYFKPSFQALLDDGDSEGQIILDNIKVVHF